MVVLPAIRHFHISIGLSHSFNQGKKPTAHQDHAKGSGKSKKEAEQQAARRALNKLQ